MPNDEEILTESTEPLEVKIINKEPKLKVWNDSYEDFEYDEHEISDKEIEEHGNTQSD